MGKVSICGQLLAVAAGLVLAPMVLLFTAYLVLGSFLRRLRPQRPRRAGATEPRAGGCC